MQLMLEKTENEKRLDMKVKRLGDSLSRINNSYKNADKPLQSNGDSGNKYSGIDDYSKDLATKRTSQ